LQEGVDYTDVPNTQVRRITAQRLLESKRSIPHYYLTVDLNADKLLALRAELNEKLAPSGAKLSVNDFIVKASALVRDATHSSC
jgi:pyruvate dehydrogenase E2 component (dihydrolipoamide acetyltransferase)